MPFRDIKKNIQELKKQASFFRRARNILSPYIEVFRTHAEISSSDIEHLEGALKTLDTVEEELRAKKSYALKEYREEYEAQVLGAAGAMYLFKLAFDQAEMDWPKYLRKPTERVSELVEKRARKVANEV